MRTLPHDLYRAAQVRELDRLAIEVFGIPGITLMRRAGAAAFELLRRRWPQARRIAVCCGVGNNGGDGYVVAELAHAAGLSVELLQLGDGARLRGDARTAAVAAAASGITVAPFNAAALRHVDLVIDAVLGTGLNGEVTGEWRAAIEAINTAGRPVLALDIPSGLHADSGAVQGAAVRATATVTFIGLKQGLFTAAGPEHCGELEFDSLELPAEVYSRVAVAAQRLDIARFRHCLARRPRDAHKGDFGHVLVVGGDAGMAGAARLAAEAAARIGAGLVSVATRADHAAVIAAARPELMGHGVESPRDLAPLLRRATVIAVGPGLGQGVWGRAMLGAVLEARQPLVVDADALNMLALDPVRREDWILTPHPGEAGRLLGEGADAVQCDRFTAAAGLQASYGGVVVLKGPGTMVLAGDGMPALCSGGNPGMASGGMGDVLTGIIAGLVAQGIELRDAAAAGVCLHAAAADQAAVTGERGLLAADLFPHLRRLANP